MARLIRYILIVCMSILWQKFKSACPYEYEITRPPYSVPRDGIPFVKFQKRVLKRIEGKVQAIPYIIHQTHENDTVPIDMAMSIESVHQLNPEYEYRYYNGTERREFIKQYMGSTVLSCYDKLNPKAYKADLFRYSLVFVNGGCYVDMGVIFINGLRAAIEKGDMFVSSPDQISLNAAFFCATKQHPILANAIQMIVQRVAKSFYGYDPIDVTGPRLFAKAFTQYYPQRHLQIKPGTYFHNVKLLAKHAASQECISSYMNGLDSQVLFHHRYPRLVEDFSVMGSFLPHYTDYYRNRTVYNESVLVSAEGFSIKSIPAVAQLTLQVVPIKN